MRESSRKQLPTSTVLVVGGAIGGRAIVELYASYGFNVIIADKNQTVGEALAKELAEVSDGRIKFEQVDVTSPPSVKALCENIGQQFGYLSHIVSMVGGSGYSDWLGLSDGKLEDIAATTTLNLLSHQYVMRFGKPLLAACPETNRSVVLVGSINCRSSDLS
ncbi:MAG: SDR family NAD(P)-dependent oxidoreductase [Gammaproteobacteria bacterium]|nr:SDR family NAD(P)-dependent oxidoreductase [Gammaproteobacteria bacterium]